MEHILFDAFSGCVNLTSVTFEEGSQLSQIWSRAFEDCTNLTSIRIPASVTDIRFNAFAGCSNLASVTFGSNSQLASIGAWAFQNCSSLAYIIIPSTVTDIEHGVFSGCSKLTIYAAPASRPSGWNTSWNSGRPVIWGWTLNVPGTLVTLDWQNGTVDTTPIAFGGKYTLPAAMPQGCIFKGWYEDSNCNGSPVDISGTWSTGAPVTTTLYAKWESLEYGIAWVTLQASGYYGYSPFEVYGVTGLGTVTGTDIVIPAYHNGVPVLGIADNAFENSNITSVTFEIGSQLLYIGELAFAGCEYLAHIIFPDGIMEIGWLSFEGAGLQYIVMPVSLTDVGKHAFLCADWAVFYMGDYSQWCSINECDSFNNATIYFYSETYQAEYWNYWCWVDGVPAVWGNTLVVQGMIGWMPEVIIEDGGDYAASYGFMFTAIILENGMPLTDILWSLTHGEDVEATIEEETGIVDIISLNYFYPDAWVTVTATCTLTGLNASLTFTVYGNWK